MRPSKINRLTDVFTRPMTQTELMKVSGLSCAVVSRYITVLHDDRKVHIGAWRKKKHSKPMAVWHPGPGEDAPCPFVAATSTERSRRMRANMSGKRRAEQRARDNEVARRAYYRKRPVRRDPLFALFFGAPANENRIHLPARTA